jgi:hypothetical protein
MTKSSVRLLMTALLSATYLWPAVASAQSQTDPASAHFGVPSPMAADACGSYIAWGWGVPTEYGCVQPGQFSSAQQLNENQAAPIVVIDGFLAAQGVEDVDAAAAFFAADASITDSSGRSAFGTYAVRRLIDSLIGWEAGPRQATGHEVIWAESLPIWPPSAVLADLDLRLEQEVPHYAYIQIMCAVVTDGKIHTLSTLAVGSPRSCEPGLKFST